MRDCRDILFTLIPLNFLQHQFPVEGNRSTQGKSSLRSRRYSRAQGEKLEIPPAQKLSILSSPAAG